MRVPRSVGGLIAFTAAALLTLHAAKVRAWKTGRVIDSRSSQGSYVTGSQTNTNGRGVIIDNGNGGGIVTVQSTSSTRVWSVAVKANELAIVGEDYAYVILDTEQQGGDYIGSVVNAIGSRHHGCRFVVGEDLRYSQEKGTLFVIDADGKECKTAILRQERRPPQSVQVREPGPTPPPPPAVQPAPPPVQALSAPPPAPPPIQRPTVRRLRDDEPPPTITGASDAVDSASNTLVQPRAPSPGVSAPTLLSKVEPRYTEDARRAGIEGTVVLYGEVGPDGRAHNFRLLRTLGYGLDERAIEAVTAWRFRPGEKDGKPVTVASTFEVNFRVLQEVISKGLAAQSAEYIQKQLQKWRAEDAEAELGHPTAHRVATDQHGAAYGEVLTYPDPTNRYQKFDLTFDTVNKTLREIRVYPWNVTLEQCTAIWGDKFEAQQRPDGERLYLYRDQRVSVLARESGEVVSFDLW